MSQKAKRSIKEPLKLLTIYTINLTTASGTSSMHDHHWSMRLFSAKSSLTAHPPAEIASRCRNLRRTN